MRHETARTAAALGAVLVLAGCTPMEWVKPDVTAEERDQDAIACQQDAWREAQWRGWYYRPFPMAPFRDATGRRFFPGPYYYADPFGDPFLEEGRLAQFCMRNKGYELVPAEAAQ
jgi:hypothetical protein